MKFKLTVLLTVLLCCLLGMVGSVFAQDPPHVTIRDIQFTDPNVDPTSPLLGEVVKVTALVMNEPNELWIGARYGVFLLHVDNVDGVWIPRLDAWDGFFAIQGDSTEIQTGFGELKPGMVCNFTGRIDEFGGFTEIEVFGSGYNPDPIIPVEILAVDVPLPEPRLLTGADINAQPQAEQWEGMYARIDRATVINNNANNNWATFNDASNASPPPAIGEYSLWFYNNLPAPGNGSYAWPAAGSVLRIDGFIREEGTGWTINPLDTTDIPVIEDPPPVITNAARSSSAPTASEGVIVSATITDNGAVASATLHYSVDESAFQQATMTTSGGDSYNAIIPSQSDGAFVRYFISADDDLGGTGILPGDTSRAAGTIFWYDVRDNGLSIADVQNTHGYAIDASGYTNMVVTIRGNFTVMTDSNHFVGDAYVQEAADKWSGIWLNDLSDIGESATFGDEITRVTGTVQEVRNTTRIDLITALEKSTNVTTPYDPILLTTGDLNNTGPDNEAYEGVLIRVENAEVINPFADAPSNFGEFTIDDGTGELRVDDQATAFRGNLDSMFVAGDKYNFVAFGFTSFGNYKIIPRDSITDVQKVVGIEDDGTTIPEEFSLEQNYPNPFNPTTNIIYNLPQSGEYSLKIYNLLGQEVYTLVNGQLNAGRHQITWNGVDNFGTKVGSGIYFYRLSGENVALAKKMILMK